MKQGSRLYDRRYIRKVLPIIVSFDSSRCRAFKCLTGMLTVTPANTVMSSREAYMSSYSDRVSVIFNDRLLCLSGLLGLFCFQNVVKQNKTLPVNPKTVGRCACWKLLNHRKCDRHGLLDSAYLLLTLLPYFCSSLCLLVYLWIGGHCYMWCCAIFVSGFSRTVDVYNDNE